MKEQLKAIISRDKEFNEGDMAAEVFGFRRDAHYDILVVAPGWNPMKILNWTDFEVTQTASHAYVNGYEVKMGDKLVAWAQTGAGGCNLIDHLTLCVELDFDKLVFVGAVGGLKKGFEVGDVCTPETCIEGTMANAYLTADLRGWKPFGTVMPASPAFVEEVLGLADFPVKKASVFCTDSISCEYFHLDFIKSFDTDLIEMETSSFYRLADLMEKKAVALLVVSDNSANGEPLLGRGEGQQAKYNFGRKSLVPRLLQKIAEM